MIAIFIALWFTGFVLSVWALLLECEEPLIKPGEFFTIIFIAVVFGLPVIGWGLWLIHCIEEYWGGIKTSNVMTPSDVWKKITGKIK